MPNCDELSEAEERLLLEIFKQHGHKNRWVLVEETHRLPEWKNPGTSSLPITYREIFKALHKGDEEISAAPGQLKAITAPLVCSDGAGSAVCNRPRLHAAME